MKIEAYLLKKPNKEHKPAIEKLCPDEELRELLRNSFLIPKDDTNGESREFKRRLFCTISYLAEISSPTWIFLNGLNFRDTPSIAKALSKYTFSADYLRWLMEQMLRKERTDVVLLIEKKLEEIGAHNEVNRFEL